MKKIVRVQEEMHLSKNTGNKKGCLDSHRWLSEQPFSTLY